MKKYLLSMLIIFTILGGCAAVPIGHKSDELNNISIGMSKSDVLSTIGQPSRVSAKKGLEYLIYHLVDDVDYTQSSITLGLAPPVTQKSDYFVKLVNGKVISFGKVGDFGTSIK